MNHAPPHGPDRPPGAGPLRSHIRPMRGWWLRHPRFQRYMLREATALVLLAYALLLLAGLWSLARGPAAWSAWRAWLDTPASVALHGLALPLLLFHSLTWFQVLPKTLPRVPLPAAWITAGALGLAGLLSLALWMLLTGVLR